MAFTRSTPPTWRKPFFYDIEAGTKVSISAEDGTEIYTFEYLWEICVCITIVNNHFFIFGF